MTDYFIIRTRHGKERVVEKAITAMGFTAWTPVEVRAYRYRDIGRKQLTKLKECPVMPKTVLATVPRGLHGNLYQIRDFVRVDCDAALDPLKIPASHIEAFWETLDAWNARESARIMRGNRGKPEKKKWRKLEPQTLGAVMAEMFGTLQQEKEIQ